MKLAFLLTCHNRKKQTVSSISSVLAQHNPDGHQIDIILVDDGSTDGTSEAVAAIAPSAVILKGNGSLFWNGGMYRAFEYAIDHGYDYYVWLNDDTILYNNAISRVLNFFEQVPLKSIIIGSQVDPDSGKFTYGGFRQESKLRKLNFRIIPPADELLECDTMNGNFVVIPAAMVNIVGNLDPAFTHALGDFDYGLRARKNGCKIWIAPGYYGTCARNKVEGNWKDYKLSLREGLRKLNSVKGLPMKEWKIFAKKYAGFFWPVYWLSPYIRFFVSALRAK